MATKKAFEGSLTIDLTSGYGGGIVLITAKAIATAGSDVQITATNCHRAPLFVKGVTTAQQWDDTARHYPGNFGEIHGDMHGWAVPSSYLRNRSGVQIEASLDYWDTALQHCYDFAALTSAEVANKRRQWFVFDIDLGWCAGHSGNPIAYMRTHTMTPRALSVPITC